MPLLGSGVLAIWNDITPEAESDFIDWHVREHIPERVGIPGFLRARRYVARGSSPKYFNFYETDALDVLGSAAYHARLNSPSPWTKRVVTGFRNTTRTACTVIHSAGMGISAWVETVQLQSRPGLSREAFIGSMVPLLERVGQQAGVVGIHLLEGSPDTTRVKAAEKALLKEPDKLADWILLTETISAERAAELRESVLTNDALAAAGAESISRGLYGLDFALAQTDLSAQKREA